MWPTFWFCYSAYRCSNDITTSSSSADWLHNETEHLLFVPVTDENREKNPSTCLLLVFHFSKTVLVRCAWSDLTYMTSTGSSHTVDRSPIVLFPSLSSTPCRGNSSQQFVLLISFFWSLHLTTTGTVWRSEDQLVNENLCLQPQLNYSPLSWSDEANRTIQSHNRQATLKTLNWT